jgi:hypothetical protein
MNITKTSTKDDIITSAIELTDHLETRLAELQRQRVAFVITIIALVTWLSF